MMNNLRQPDRAFTLTELLVSIAAIALLTLGVGRIFRSVSSLVSIGSAVSDIDQVARAIERQLRDDFDAFNRMRPDETFLALRMREVGDINHNQFLDIGDGEIPIYLTIEDRNADRRDIAEGLIDGPYEEGSRAVTQRVDEMMFIGASDGIDFYTSFQVDMSLGGGDSTSRHARIYYGHGLRPIRDPDWPLEAPDDPSSRRAPTRWFFADGDFGSSPTPVINDPALKVNRFDPDNRTGLPGATGRNEFAQQWSLARQPLLLFGPEAAGFPNNNSGQVISPIGLQREISPYARDIELAQRVTAFRNIDNELDLEDWGLVNRQPGDPFTPRPDYRRIRDGRVDLCAMSHLDLRRWLEGQDFGNSDTGLPFNSGRLADYIGDDEMDQASVNSPLWIRSVSDDVANRVGVQRAIAGMFNRIQIESTPPKILRSPDPTRNEALQPEDAQMDLHALLAARCSNFEIAWSDGSTVIEDIPDPGAGSGLMAKRGELIWFDIRPLATNGSNTFRSLYDTWLNIPSNLVDLQNPKLNRANPGLDLWNQSEIAHRNMALSGDSTDEGFLDTGFQGYYKDTETEPGNMLGGNALGVPDANLGNLPAYSTFLSGGAPRVEDEALVIFPFREPTSSGGWGSAWNKTLLIRIRLTLHDTLGRLKDGKDFEFIFSLDPQGF